MRRWALQASAGAGLPLGTTAAAVPLPVPPPTPGPAARGPPPTRRARTSKRCKWLHRWSRPGADLPTTATENRRILGA